MEVRLLWVAMTVTAMYATAIAGWREETLDVGDQLDRRAQL